ncbi:hypothetical protein [Burkholderia sp. Bp9090]|uniref:hypothetical protein n=1 Tax=Burkholderia sp. Bp9090 TaxID=2184567 RepID=UPI000F5DEC8E|nr:hypothetical protein [Burkholderia sp. Bp9090]
MIGYSCDSLIRAEHYLGCKIENVAWITSLPGAEFVGTVISVVATLLLKNQFDAAWVGRYVNDHGITSTDILIKVMWAIFLAGSFIWAYRYVRNRHSLDSYRRSIVAMAMRIKQAGEQDIGKNAQIRRSRAQWRSGRRNWQR